MNYATTGKWHCQLITQILGFLHIKKRMSPLIFSCTVIFSYFVMQCRLDYIHKYICNKKHGNWIQNEIKNNQDLV